MIVDRFEGDIAVCEREDGSFTDIPIADISGSPKEGDVLVYTEDGKYAVDEEKTESRRQEILAKHRRLWKD